MKYAGLIENDFVNGEGVSVTVFLQGCPHHCEGCHNQETWSFNDGIEINDNELINKILSAISKNGIKRNLSISGGEPLCNENVLFVKNLITAVRDKYPKIKILCWTGYDYNTIYTNRPKTVSYELGYVLDDIDVLISGPFIKKERDITLKLRGSRNQQIWRKVKGEFVLDN